MPNTGATQKPVVTSIVYQDPGSPITKDFSTGLQIQFQDSNIIVGRLMQGGNVIASFSPAKTNQINLPLTYPLAEGLSCYIEVQSLESISSQPDWNQNSTAIVPVLPSVLELSDGVVKIDRSSLYMTFNWSNHFPVTAYAMLYGNGTFISSAFVSSFKNFTTLKINYTTPTPPYKVILRPLIPLTTPSVWPPSTFPTSSAHSAGSGVNYTLPTQAPEITGISYDGGIVTASWPALAVPDDVEVTYELLFICDSVTTSCPATSTGGTAPLPVGFSESCEVSARVNYDVIKGPRAAPVVLIPGIIYNIKQTTAIIGESKGIATLTWEDNYTAPTGSSVTYNLNFSGGSPADKSGNSGTSYQLLSVLAVNELKYVSIARVVTSTNPALTVTCPSSPPCQLGTNQPTLPSAQYDGTIVSVTWKSETVGEVLAYTVILTITPSTGSPTTESHSAPGSATSLLFQPATTISASDTLTVTLQVSLMGEAGPGLAASSIPVSFIPAYFIGKSAPYTYPVTALKAISIPPASGIKLYLPQGNYIVASKSFAEVSNPPFKLVANSEPYPYILTIDKSTWTISSNTIRSTVQTAYVAFIKAAESTGNFTPWGISVLQEAIARHTPQSYAEMLYYSYGLNLADSPNIPHVDLRPGMVLRVMPSDYIVVPGYDRNGQKLNYLDGYTNGAPIDYDIGSYYDTASNWHVGFDTFISQLVSAGALTVTSPPTTHAPNVGGVAEAADLYSLGAQNTFYRLFIPSTLLTPTGPGSTKPESQFNLVCADSFTKLEKKTNGATNNTNTYFRGRAVLKLCIRVTINGNEAVVPIATTLANILERAGRMPPRNGVKLEGLKLERAIGQADSVGGKACEVGRSYAVRLDYQVTNYTGGESALDIPLLHGDRLSFGA